MKRIFKNRKGQGATEYIMILALLVGVVIIAGKVFKDKMPDVVKGVFDKINTGIGDAGSTEG